MPIELWQRVMMFILGKQYFNRIISQKKNVWFVTHDTRIRKIELLIIFINILIANDDIIIHQVWHIFKK